MAFFWLTSGTVTAGGVRPREVLGTEGAWGRTSPECPPCGCPLTLHPLQNGRSRSSGLRGGLG